MIEYTILRSKRKTIAIYITRDATIEVRAPLQTKQAEIDRFVLSKHSWINKHLSRQKQVVEERKKFTLHYGDSILLQGEQYPIYSKPGNRAGFDGKGLFLPPGLSAEEIKGVVVQVYKAIAKNLLTTKVSYYATLMGLTPTAVKVNSAKSRWGSCSSKRSINFSWYLVMADDAAIDYVVVHELAHIKEQNHSVRFWQVVAAVFPDYQERKKGLTVLQQKIQQECWE